MKFNQILKNLMTQTKFMVTMSPKFLIIVLSLKIQKIYLETVTNYVMPKNRLYQFRSDIN